MNDTKNSDNANLDDDIDDLDKKDRKRERVLRGILDNLRNKKDHFLAISVEMGSSHSYISSVPLKWFANVHFASDLKIFQEHHDEREKSVAINDKTLELLSQRKPDWRRQIVMTTYLSVREHHKFPPVLLVAYQNWIFDPESDKWGADKRALEDSVTHVSLDTGSWIVDFNHSDTHFYALDGQHRLMAVKGLRELLDGRLPQKKKDGTPVSARSIKIDDILPYAPKNVSESDFISRLNSIMEEKIGVEIIPAVQIGETLEEAFARLRKIFVDVNLNAKKPEKSETSILNETDGFCIVARRVMVSHPLFYRNEKLYVDTKKNQLDEKSEDYTTLQAIVGVAKLYLGQLDGFIKWKNPVCGIKEAGFLRPTDEDLEKGVKKLSAYFDAMMKLPSHGDMIRGESVSKIRRRKKQIKGEIIEGNDNVLFRPLAQEALAQAIGELERERGLTPEQIIKTLSKKDDLNDSALRLTEKASPFFGVLCDPVTKKMRKDSYRGLASRMFRYLLGGGETESEDRERLRKDVFESRRYTAKDAEHPRATSYGGEEVSEDKFELPHPW